MSKRPEWLEQIIDKVKTSQGWPDKKFPKVAARVIEDLEQWGSGPDDFIILVHYLIETIEKLEPNLDDPKDRSADPLF